MNVYSIIKKSMMNLYTILVDEKQKFKTECATVTSRTLLVSLKSYNIWREIWETLRDLLVLCVFHGCSFIFQILSRFYTFIIKESHIKYYQNFKYFIITFLIKPILMVYTLLFQSIKRLMSLFLSLKGTLLSFISLIYRVFIFLSKGRKKTLGYLKNNALKIKIL